MSEVNTANGKIKGSSGGSFPKLNHSSKSSLSTLLSQNLMSLREIPEKSKVLNSKQIKRRNKSNISSEKLFFTSNRSIARISGNESVAINSSANDLKTTFANPALHILNTFPTDLETDSDENHTRNMNQTQQSFSNKAGISNKIIKYIEKTSYDMSSILYDSKFLEKYSSQELQDIFKKLILHTEDLNKCLQNRFCLLENMIDSLKPEVIQRLGYPANNFDDISKAQEAIRLLTQTLSNSSKTEIELGFKNRELEKKILENTILISKYKKIKSKCAELRKDLDLLRENREALHEEINHYNRLLTSEKRNNGELNKKVDVLERRLKFVLDIDMNASAPEQYKLRTSLTELMKEAENLKRELAIKKKENEKFTEKCTTQDLKITRLLKKIENLKNNRENEDKKERIKMLDLSKKDGLNIFDESEIPRNLEFRVNSLKGQYSNLLSDIIEHGTSLFIQHFMKHTDPMVQREEIGLITSQFISFKEFGERMNKLIRELANINKMTNLEDLLININRNFRGVFQSENVYLWVSDQKNGLLFTYDENKIEKKCLFNKGLFGELMRNGKPINKNDVREKTLYEPIGEDKLKHRDSVLLFPIKILENRVFGILEISNIRSDLYGFDDEYYAMLVSVFCSQVLRKIMDEDILKLELRHISSFQEFFCALMLARNRFEFTGVINFWCEKLLGVQGCRFFFIENNKMVRYQEKREEFEIKTGFAGLVASQKRASIIVDISHSSHYNKFVDIHSLLPIYAVPLTVERPSEKMDLEPEIEVMAVFEVVLKQKLKLRERHILLDYNELKTGQVDQLNTYIQTFCNYIKSSMQIFYKNSESF